MNAVANGVPTGGRERAVGRRRWITFSGLVESLCVVAMWGSILWVVAFSVILRTDWYFAYGGQDCVSRFMTWVTGIFFVLPVVGALLVVATPKLRARRRLFLTLGVAFLVQIVNLRPILIK